MVFLLQPAAEECERLIGFLFGGSEMSPLFLPQWTLVNSGEKETMFLLVW
jgi:hypothetical protein